MAAAASTVGSVSADVFRPRHTRCTGQLAPRSRGGNGGFDRPRTAERQRDEQSGAGVGPASLGLALVPPVVLG